LFLHDHQSIIVCGLNIVEFHSNRMQI
jgi:hypothetical protein